MILDERHGQVDDGTSWLRRRDIQRVEVGWVAVAHLLVAAAMVLAPRDQIVGPSTAAIFGLIPLPVWVAWYTVASLLAARAVSRATPGRLVAAATAVFPPLVAWIVGFSFGLANGNGDVLWLILWVSHLVMWAFLALRLHLGGTGARWGGS